MRTTVVHSLIYDASFLPRHGLEKPWGDARLTDEENHFLPLSLSVGLLMAFVFIAPSAEAEYDCGRIADCAPEDGPTDCVYKIEQGTNDAEAHYRHPSWGQHESDATASAAVTDRWIRIINECSTIDLVAYTALDSAHATIEVGCDHPVCRANANYNVWIYDSLSPKSAHCLETQGGTCGRLMTESAAIRWNDIPVNAPSTHVTTKNCANGIVQADLDGGGTANDDLAREETCAQTNVYIGPLPI